MPRIFHFIPTRACISETPNWLIEGFELNNTSLSMLQVIVAVAIPVLSAEVVVQTYKITPRAVVGDFDH